jgi:type IV secretory pathway VirJ component
MHLLAASKARARRLAPLLLGALLLAPRAAGQGYGDDVGGLPLVEVPAPGAARGRTLAIVLSGDGDWAGKVNELSSGLAAGGVPVVGFRMRAYLTSGQRTPADLARDVERVARHYSAAWGTSQLALIGYSRGADLAPFAANRLPADLRARLRLVALIGPAEQTSFHFELSDLWRDNRHPTDLPTLPEAERLRGIRTLCVYGADEQDSLCRIAPPGLLQLTQHPGGHRVHDESVVIDLLLRELAPR